MHMAARYEVSNTASGKFHFVLKAGNNEVILSSQQYASKETAMHGVESVKKHGPDDKNYDRKESSKGEPYFNLVASNGQIIGTSEMYTAVAGRDNGIESVKRNCGSEVKDLTT
jgi:uncharacterized protein